MDTLFHTQIFSNLEEDVEPENGQIRIGTTTFSEKKVNVKVTAIETIGFGAKIKNKYCWYPMSSIIDSKNFLRVFQQEQPRRKAGDLEELVHACIFFITPTTNGLCESDIQAMQEFGSRVNLIPVIGKADSYTRGEILEYKRMICQSCEENSIRVYSEANEFPYTVIGASNEDGVVLRGRRHKQGTAQVDNELHCDFKQLKGLLINNLPELSEAAEIRFQEHRTHLLTKRLKLARLERPIGGNDDAVMYAVGMQQMQRAEYWSNPFFTETCRLLNRHFEELLKSVDDRAEKRIAKKHDESKQELEKLYRKIEELKLSCRRRRISHREEAVP